MVEKSRKRRRKSDGKANDGDPGNQAKQQKRESVLQHELPWSEVKRSEDTGFDDFDGMTMLEEVDNVHVVYQITPAGKIATFQMKATSPDPSESSLNEAEWAGISFPSHLAKSESGIQAHNDNHITLYPESIEEMRLSEWGQFQLHPWLLKGLQNQGFKSPTPIQIKALPLALQGRDVIGIAQTGSGKTLAYGLPILQGLLSEALSVPKSRRQLRALILTPTRELALQVCDHINAILKPIITHERSNGSPPNVSVGTAVGGMSVQKQRRILQRGMDILVATPGRLWDILGEDDSLPNQIKNLRYLVMDEADRMVEQGHFKELDSILRLTLRSPFADILMQQNSCSVSNEERNGSAQTLQTFIFSATMSRNLQWNLKHGNRRRKPIDQESTLDELLLRLDFRDPEPQVVDIANKGGILATLRENKLECLSTEKDMYLYYFLLRYPGKSLVFLSTVDGIRRLTPLLELLKLKTFPLHSQLEQRQRLKNLDKFKQCENGILLATDIAARGLDIPAVDHVLHYQVPRSADIYIHRNGRTARQNNPGFAMLMCSPEERKAMRALFLNLGRREDDIPEFEVNHDVLLKLKPRLELAREIDLSLHKTTKTNFDENWMRDKADAMDIIVDDEDEINSSRVQRRKQKDGQLASKKMKLNALLSKPVIALGVIPGYITSGVNPIADELLSGNVLSSMLGVRKGEASHASGREI